MLNKFIINVIARKLVPEQAISAYLIHLAEIVKMNRTIIAKIFNEVIHVLWSENAQYQRIFVLITNGVKYMIKTANALNVLYFYMKHITCALHALH